MNAGPVGGRLADGIGGETLDWRFTAVFAESRGVEADKLKIATNNFVTLYHFAG